jgi:hypothetical protein
MRLTPEALPMLQPPIFRQTLLTSLTFGAVSAVFSAPLTAQIPNLSGYDSQTRQSMELACISDKTNGPAPYAACLNRQIASLQSSPGIPNLSGYDSQTRQSMELACISDKTNGPAPYAACLNRQIASLQGSPSIPNLSGYDSQTRQSMELACHLGQDKRTRPLRRVPEPADCFAARLAEHPESERLRKRDATSDVTVDKWRDRCTFRQWKRHGRPATGEGRLAASIRRYVVST